MSFSTLVVGVGYLGKRFCELGDQGLRGLTRANYDLDIGGELPVDLPADYRVLYTVPPSRDARDDIRLKRLLEALEPAPRRFVYISTTGVYGDHGGADVDEDTPVNPRSPSAALRVAAEHALIDWASRNRCDAVILRVPGIYGPGRLGIERVREQTPIVCEEDVGPGNRIHVDDLARAHLLALEHLTPGKGLCLNLGTGVGYSVKEVIEVKIGYDGIVMANSKKTPPLKLTRKDIFLALAKPRPVPRRRDE